MKKTVLVIMGMLLLSIGNVGFAQTVEEELNEEKEKTELREEVFTVERAIETYRIEKTIERLKTAYPAVKLLEMNPVSKEVKIIYDRTISEEDYRELTNYFKH